ncbi:MAG: threonine synthase [Flavisolibacter sp.]
MKFYSLNRTAPAVDFKEATIRGQAPDGGLYFPERIPSLPRSMVAEIEQHSNEDIAFALIQPYVGQEIPEPTLRSIIRETIAFPMPLIPIREKLYALELFHGPTLAFKDVGARFMSRCLSYFARERGQKVIVLVATSGDTGGAVAHSFYGSESVDVVILYPSGKVSPLQEKQLTTLGKNIHALEIEGDFDDCQQMVKQAFADTSLCDALFLTSANSINVARWLPQQFYYAFAWKQWPHKDQPPVISVPSGNFGNLCAGMLAWSSGIPVKKFVAACNANDVIPAYFQTGRWENKPAQSTISNAMDVAAPSNFVRILELFQGEMKKVKESVLAVSVGDAATKETMHQVYAAHDYVLDPHSAVAYRALEDYLDENPGDKGILVSTAHPVKFPETVEEQIGRPIDHPQLAALRNRPLFKIKMANDYARLKEYLSQFS